MPTFERDGLQFVYDVAGPVDAPVLVLLHGYRSSRHAWRLLIEPLAKEYRVIAPDLRGHGQSAAPAGLAPYLVGEYAADLDAMLRAEGVERFIPVGCSFGGMLAVHYATMVAPERLDALVLSDTSPAYASDLYAEEFRERERRIDAEVAIVADKGLDAYLERATSRIADPGEREEARRRLSRTSANGFVGAAHMRRSRPSVIHLLRERLTMPVMLVTGDQDPVRSAFDVMRAELPGACAVTFEGIGHGVPMLSPERFFGELMQFLRLVRAGAPVASEVRVRPPA